MNLFQSVRFRLEPAGDASDLILQATEKPWGPTYFHFGLNISDDFVGGAKYGIRVNMLRTNLNALGGEWRTDVELGSHPSFRTDFFQPLDFRTRFFVNPVLSPDDRREEVFDEEGTKFASYQVDISASSSMEGISSAGSESSGGRLSQPRPRQGRHGIRGPSHLRRPGGGVLLGAALNTLDRPAIPHQGMNLEAHGNFSRESFGADASYDKVQLQGVGFLGSGRHTVFAGAGFGTNLGSTIPIYDAFLLGGLSPSAGSRTASCAGQLYTTAQIGYHYRIGSLPSVLGTGIYVGALAEAGNVWQSTSEVSASDLIYSGTAILGADTILGPSSSPTATPGRPQPDLPHAGQGVLIMDEEPRRRTAHRRLRATRAARATPPFSASPKGIRPSVRPIRGCSWASP
jgi:NTE family protein